MSKKPEIFGDKQLDQLFRKLKDSQKRSIVIAAYRKASKPMQAKMKSNLLAKTDAKRSGNLFKSIGYKPVSRLPILHLGARKFGNFKGYHSHLIEKGTGERYYTTQSGAIHPTGRIKGRYFFQSAFQSTVNITAEGFQDSAIEAFIKLIRRANAKKKT